MTYKHAKAYGCGRKAPLESSKKLLGSVLESLRSALPLLGAAFWRSRGFLVGRIDQVPCFQIDIKAYFQRISGEVSMQALASACCIALVSSTKPLRSVLDLGGVQAMLEPALRRLICLLVLN